MRWVLERLARWWAHRRHVPVPPPGTTFDFWKEDEVKLTLRRLAETDEYTFGALYDAEEKQLCVTLEEPWRDANEDGLGDKNVSRIPAGTFEGFLRNSPARGYVVPELKGVPGRGNIQIHKGNTVADTLGCILVGTAYGKASITESKKAFEKLMAHLNGCDTFTLTVVDIEPAQAAA